MDEGHRRDLSWQDVLDFCGVGYTEGVRVDYKAQMPKGGVAKHVAAFANTLGGVLLVGAIHFFFL